MMIQQHILPILGKKSQSKTSIPIWYTEFDQYAKTSNIKNMFHDNPACG